MQPNNTMGSAPDMIQRNPALQNNPNAHGMTDAIKSGWRACTRCAAT